MKKVILALAILTLVTLPQIRGRVGVKNVSTTTAPVASAKLVSPLEAKKLIAGEDVFLLDVHTPEQTHIPGTDAFIPFDQIKDSQSKLPQDKEKPILVYCRSGNMSKTASEELIKLGYQNVYDLEGGIVAFREVNAEVKLTPASVDLGPVAYGEVSQTEFTLTNFTPAPLKVTRITTSCGCTKATLAQKELKPYESAPVTITFDPAVHKDDTDVGEVTRTIYIETDNPNFPKITAEIQAEVIKEN